MPHDLDRLAWGAPELQLAADGWWEDAQVVAMPCHPDEVDAAYDRLPSDDRAIEVLWPGPPTVFVGTRRTGAATLPLAELAVRDDWTPSSALEVLAGGPLGPPTGAALGAFNSWRSTGPLEISLTTTCAALTRALKERPELETCADPVALEVRYDSPAHLWWAVEVSVRRPHGHRVLPGRVEAMLGEFARLALAD